jgi:hypothetical protein
LDKNARSLKTSRKNYAISFRSSSFCNAYLAALNSFFFININFWMIETLKKERNKTFEIKFQNFTTTFAHLSFSLSLSLLRKSIEQYALIFFLKPIMLCIQHFNSSLKQKIFQLKI